MKTLCISIIILTLLITGCGLLTVEADATPQPQPTSDCVTESPVSP